jgi:hypothetical protein
VPVRPPLPPFDRDSAAQKVQAAEDAWNTRDPERVASAYTRDSLWQPRLFHCGHDAIVEFLRGKRERELDYVLRKSCGRSTLTASPCVSSTNGMTARATGFVVTATSCGSSTPMVS